MDDSYKPYKILGTVVGVHFVIMFALTYLGVYRFGDIFVNLNRFYMAVAMVAPMVILMLLFMAHMFKVKKLNFALYGIALLLFVGAVAGIRTQAFVGDSQFLKSMIPHHSIAVKTCTYANLKDEEIKELCKQIIKSQEEEITQMKGIMNRLER